MQTLQTLLMYGARRLRRAHWDLPMILLVHPKGKMHLNIQGKNYDFTVEDLTSSDWIDVDGSEFPRSISEALQ